MPQLSIWEKETFFAHQDIIIVGAGFCGLWSALHLKQLHPAYHITILDRGLIPTGASTRNAGFSCFGSPSELLQDAKLMGNDEMWKLVTMRYKGLQKITTSFDASEIDYEVSTGYECFTAGSADWEHCRQKLKWLNEGLRSITGQADIFTIADDKLDDFKFRGFDHLVENRLEGYLHPGKLVRALLKKVQSLGVQVMTGVDVLSYLDQEDRVSLTTNIQADLTASQLLICTNAFTPRLIPSIDIFPNRGQVLITAPVENLALKGTFHFDKGYYYFRNYGNRVLLGGARNKAFAEEHTKEMETSHTIQNELEQFLARYILPGIPFTVTDRWTGIMAMGTEKTPLVKRVSKNVFCCVRMSGMGVALAPVASQKAVQLMSSRY